MRKGFSAAVLCVCLWLLPVAAHTVELKGGLDAVFASAKAAAVYDLAGGRFLYTKNADAPLPIASTTKLLSALLVLEEPALDTAFALSAEMLGAEGSSMGLAVGDVVTLRDLAWGMLLASGNDAAEAAAHRVAGSVPAFASRMNERAAEWGLAQSHFENPSGLDAPGHQSTAAELAIIGARALENPELAAMVATKSVCLEYGSPPSPRWLRNHNSLLWRAPGVFGLKTGFTKKSGRCLVSAAQEGERRLLCVTLSCPDDFTAHPAAYRLLFSEPTAAPPALAGLRVPVTASPVRSLPVSAPAFPAVYLREGETPVLRISLPPFLYAPVEEGELVGSATLELHGETLAELPLFAAAAAPRRIERSRCPVLRFFEEL